MLNYFATSICRHVIQVVFSTGTLKALAQVSISILTQVHKLYLYLLKKKINFSKILTNLTNQKWKKLKCMKTLTYYSCSEAVLIQLKCSVKGCTKFGDCKVYWRSSQDMTISNTGPKGINFLRGKVIDRSFKEKILLQKQHKVTHLYWLKTFYQDFHYPKITTFIQNKDGRYEVISKNSKS